MPKKGGKKNILSKTIQRVKQNVIVNVNTKNRSRITGKGISRPPPPPSSGSFPSVTVLNPQPQINPQAQQQYQLQPLLQAHQRELGLQRDLSAQQNKLLQDQLNEYKEKEEERQKMHDDRGKTGAQTKKNKKELEAEKKQQEELRKRQEAEQKQEATSSSASSSSASSSSDLLNYNPNADNYPFITQGLANITEALAIPPFQSSGRPIDINVTFDPRANTVSPVRKQHTQK